MNLSTRSFRTLIIAAIAVFAAVGMASAQPTFNNPPCAGVTLINTTPCPINVTFTTVPAGVWPAPVAIPPLGSIVVPVPPPGVAVWGVGSCAGGLIPFNPPFAPAPCNPGDWWIASIALPPTCWCFDICADPVTCTITFYGCTAPPCRIP